MLWTLPTFLYIFMCILTLPTETNKNMLGTFVGIFEVLVGYIGVWMILNLKLIFTESSDWGHYDIVHT